MANGLNLSGLIAALSNDNRYRDENGQIDPTWLAAKVPMQAALARYQGLQNVGGLTNIGIAGPNTAQAPDGSIVNYYVAGTNPGEYSVGSDGRLVSGSTQFDTNSFDPSQLLGTATVGNGQTAFITPSSVKPTFTQAPANSNDSWLGGLASLAPVAAGPILGSLGAFGGAGADAAPFDLYGNVYSDAPMTVTAAGEGAGLGGSSAISTTPVGGADTLDTSGFGAYDTLNSYPNADWSGALNTGGDTLLPDGVTAPSPTISVPGYGDVYGSPASILKAINNGTMPLSALQALGNAAGGANALKMLFGAGTATTGGSSLSAVLKAMGVDTGNYGGLVDALGRAIPGVVGAVASNNQANTLAELAKNAQAFGAPSRARYEASMTPGFDPNSIPGYSGAVNDAMDATLHSLSTTGNPFGNPTGLIDANKRVVAGTALPAIQNYQSMNATNGGLSAMNNSVPGLLAGSATANNNVVNSLGAAAADVFNPSGSSGLTGGTSLAQLLKQMQGNNIFGTS